MKNIILVLSFLMSFSFMTFGQISIDTLNIYSQNSNIVDSIFVGGISSGQELSELSIVPTNDACGTVNIQLNFKGCSPVQTTFFDSIITVGYPVSRFHIVAKWDTLFTCPYPTSALNLDTLIWDNCGTVGLNQILIDDKIKIFPNPSNNNLKIDVSNSIEIGNIELFDISGKKAKTYNTTDRNLNISGFSSGTYFLRISTTEGGLAHKVIIE
jgi:hypothetical protein